MLVIKANEKNKANKERKKWLKPQTHQNQGPEKNPLPEHKDRSNRNASDPDWASIDTSEKTGPQWPLYVAWFDATDQ